MAFDCKLRQNRSVCVYKKNTGMGHAVRGMPGRILLIEDAKRLGQFTALVGKHRKANISVSDELVENLWVIVGGASHTDIEPIK